MSIFNFNHIDKNKIKEEIQEIKELYKYYHYRDWCYQKAYTHYKKVNLASNIVSAGLVIIGSVAGSITANPIIIGTVTGAYVLLKTFCETKDYKRKIEMSKYAYTTYQKILADLKTSLRGAPFNKQDFLKEVNILNDTIIDFCPLVTKFEKQYGKNSSLPPLLTLINILLDEIIDLSPPLTVII